MCYKTISSKGQYSNKPFINSIHNKLKLIDIGFDLRASWFYLLKRMDSTYHINSKVLVIEPNQYMCDTYNNIIEMIQYPDGTLIRDEIDGGATYATNGWDEFDSAPILNLNMILQRPVIKSSTEHSYYTVPLNFNFPDDELMEQIKIIKETLDQQKKDFREGKDIEKDTLLEMTFSGCEEIKDVVLEMGDYSREDSIPFKEGTFSTDWTTDIKNFSGKKQNPSIKFADILYTYDCMKIIERGNRKLAQALSHEIEKIKSMKYTNEEEDIEYTKQDFKLIKNSEAFTKIYFLINGKNSKNSTTIAENWAYAKDFIDNKKYESLM